MPPWKQIRVRNHDRKISCADFPGTSRRVETVPLETQRSMIGRPSPLISIYLSHGAAGDQRQTRVLDSAKPLASSTVLMDNGLVHAS